MTVSLSCTLNPWPDIADHALIAERLGYSRVWVNDSPNVMRDVWVVLAEIARSTTSIGVGPAVIVPSLRHVVVSANAIATLEELAPGRVSVAVGTGNTGRRLLGQKPQPWSEVELYVSQLRTLLAGDLTEVDGRPTRLMHPPGMVATGRIPEILIAAMGPRGLDTAQRVGDGVFRINQGVDGFDTCVVTVTGTVLSDDEEYSSPRVLRDAGPAVAVAYHGILDSPEGAARIRTLPHGPEYLAALELVQQDTRHLAVHGGHFTSVDGSDSMLVDAETVQRFSFSGHRPELQERIRALIVSGATEIAFHPVAADTARELKLFAELVNDLAN
jgi:5,10-methylenetetrahydromethanopterin reductase